MKFFLSVLAVLFVVASPAFSQQSQWQWVNPTPQGNLLNGITANNQDTAFAIGEYGVILRTINGGQTWHVTQNAGGLQEPLFALGFATSTTGVALGSSGQILRTTDAGGTWLYEQLPVFRDLFAVTFASTTTGWIAGGDGTVFKTTNAGVSWTQQVSGTSNTMYGIYFLNTTTGWIVGSSGTILKTTNGGTSWIPQSSGTTQPLYSIYFTSSAIGYAVGAAGILLKTVNGGTTWTPQPSGTVFSLYAMQFVTSQIGWVTGGFGIIMKTTNGGITWSSQTSNTYDDLFGLRFTSTTVGWAVGDYGTIVKTTDGGATWKSQSSGNKNIINGIHFPTAANGYAVGEEGTVIRSTDGGLTWSQTPSGFLQVFYGVHFVSALEGWVVGDSAVILHTTNGGSTWLDQNSRTDLTLYSVYFFSATRGWAVGDFGTILSTTNGGITWAAQTSNSFASLLRIKFATQNVGWTVGSGGTILKTIDGGLNWFPQFSGSLNQLYSLEVIDANTVYAVGDYGTIMKTTDGGDSWISLTPDVDVSLYGISFYSPSLGWIAGDDGTIIRTTNAGATWETQNSGTFNTLIEMQVTKSTSGGLVFASGYRGTILCSSISPLPLKTWTGAFDTLWTTSGNWSPVGVPSKVDSIYIPPAPRDPVLRGTTQQLNFASIKIGAGGKLKIGNGINQLSVKGGIDIGGTLEMEAGAQTDIYVGKNFLTTPSGNFIPALSTIGLIGAGQVRGTFYNLVVGNGATAQSQGNIFIQNSLLNLASLTLRQSDTLTVLSSNPAALQGSGTTGGGTVKRAIAAGSTIPYQFESPATYLRFLPTGTLPDTVTMTVQQDLTPPNQPESLFVKRIFNITATGGSNYRATLSLRYDTAEAPVTVDQLSLFRDSSDVVVNMGLSDFLDSDYVAIAVDSIRNISGKWYFGRWDYIPQHVFEFSDTMYLSDNGGLRDTLVFGAFPLATDGIDAAFGESTLGSIPPNGTFDTRWVLPSSATTLIDIRDVLTRTLLQNTYKVRIQPGPGGYPFTLQWQNQQLPPGAFLLRDAATGGTVFSIDMKSQTSFVISNPSVSMVEILHVGPSYFSFNAKWNMVSLPVTPTPDGKKTRLFPTAVSKAFAYTNGYTIKDTLLPGIAYWLKFSEAQEIGIDGFRRTADTISIAGGWNMIGSVSDPVSIQDLMVSPPNILTSSFYEYSSGYIVADSLRPSKGYWIKANAPGTMVLSTTAEAAPKRNNQEWNAPIAEMNSLTVRDAAGNRQTLYFTTKAMDESFLQTFELPPPPPEGIFDARFASRNMIEILGTDTKLPAIHFQSEAYPLTISWNLQEEGLGGIQFSERGASVGAVAASKKRQGSLQISNPSTHSLDITVERLQAEIPKEFALLQNYPNPFNPSTTISYSLPEPSMVTIRVFNLLGQRVATIADEAQYDAGTHSLRFTPTELGSGVYFYAIQARSENGREFHQVRKMLLLK